MSDPVFDRLDGRCLFCGWPCDREFCGDTHWQLWMFTRVAHTTLSEFGQRMRELAQAMQPALAQLGETLAGIRRCLVEAGLVPDAPPADPMARALHARRHRNTGPAVHADPRRNRRACR